MVTVLKIATCIYIGLAALGNFDRQDGGFGRIVHGYLWAILIGYLMWRALREVR